LLSEEHLYEALRYVELNPYMAGLETIPGSYQWSSAKERLGLRPKFYISSLPSYIEIDDWWNYLSIEDCKGEVWSVIRKATNSTKPYNGCNSVAETS
jgi:hypothetical protein